MDKKLVNFFRNNHILHAWPFDLDRLAFFVFHGDAVHVGETHDAMWTVGWIPNYAFIVGAAEASIETCGRK